jgi:hypothetical protein
MLTYRLESLKFPLIICLTLSVLFLGLAASALADVINFKKLEPFVDVKIPGWTMEGKPGGTTVKQGPMSVSQAEAEFKAGDKTLKISVTDLYGRHFPMQMGQFMEMESNEQVVRTLDVQGFKGLGQYNKNDKEGNLIISVADRFLVKVEGQKIDDLKVLQDVAQQLDLKKLATLAK